MSANWSIRSLGQPYFALAQQAFEGMAGSGLYDAGFIEYVVQCRLFALPTKYASNDENHPLVSVHDFFGPTIMSFGITPMGAISCQTKNGANLKSADGALSADGQWHTLVCSYDTGTGALILSRDGIPVATTTDAGGALLPSGVAQVRLFNGPDGIARTDVAIRSVVISTSDGQARVCTYRFDEKSGTAVAGTKDTDDFPGVSSFDLLALFMTPFGHAAKWGPVPTVGLADAYRWMIDTEYADTTPAATTFEEVAIL